MERFRRVPTRLEGPVVVEPAVFRDERGFFAETFRHNALGEYGIPVDGFVQENHSRSTRGVLRGMHFAIGDPGMGKLVRCSRGRIVDVVVDLRRGSPTYAQWEAVDLDDETLRMCWVPVGFAHGFCVLSDVADVLYRQTAYYDPAVERGIAYDDPDVGIEWPAGMELVVSERDATAPTLAEVAGELPFVFA
jgi:dTDP-4-dehydrorhamnose 3,5-epimerase